MKILIAEDEPITRRSLERQLRRWGHEVTAACDGAEAWEAYQGTDFDLVVCDWDMPNVTGVELIERIRTAPSEDSKRAFVYIIMLTGRAQTADVVQGIGSGADDFLTKPFKKAELEVRLLAGERIVRLERDLTHRSDDLRAAQADLQALATKLSKYLSPAIYRSIFEGKRDSRITTKRKNLSIFFSDIVNFTATSESLDPEELTTILNEYLAEMTDIVIQYGGTLDKYIGDAILVFFGDPETLGEEEDAYQCVAMAMEMQRRMATLRERWEARGQSLPFHIRVGITSGVCNVGNFGSDAQMSYTIIGRQVNLASRLETNSTPDKILISKSTWSLVRSRVRCAPRDDPVVAKGFANPIPAYEVIGEIDDTSDDAVVDVATSALSLHLDPRNLHEAERQEIVDALRRALSLVTPSD